MGQIRVELRYSGQVQGVGFRMTVRHLSHSYDVTGTVRNLPDGSVELIAEGDDREVERFLAAVEREFRGHIAGREERRLPAVCCFTDFEIVI